MIFLPLGDLYTSGKKKTTYSFLQQNIIFNISLSCVRDKIIIASGMIQKRIKAETLLWNILETEFIPIKITSKDHVLFQLLKDSGRQEVMDKTSGL